MHADPGQIYSTCVLHIQYIVIDVIALCQGDSGHFHIPAFMAGRQLPAERKPSHEIFIRIVQQNSQCAQSKRQ